jgi:hypothetical protein
MAASPSALTDPSSLIPLLYRADWTRLCLSAEIETRVERLRSVTISPGRDFWRPVTEYDYPDYLDDRIDVLVDAELGILLRREAFADGKPVELTEVRSLTLDPGEADDPAQFRPPPGLPVAEDSAGPGSFFDMSGPAV